MFTQAPYQRPRFRALLGGAIAFGLLLALLWQSSAVTKYLGFSLLYLPAQLGIVRQATPQEVLQVQAAGWATLRVATPGPYHVYLDSYELLGQTDADLAMGKRPWLLIQAAPSYEPLAVEYVRRGLRLYDTPFAGGRPAFSVTITHPGEYRVSARKAAALWLVPDYTSGHETRITLAIIAELAAVVLVSSCIRYWSHREHRAARRVQEQREDQRQAEAEGFWQRERQRGRKSNQ
jgi:hypothetical protein